MEKAKSDAPAKAPIPPKRTVRRRSKILLKVVHRYLPFLKKKHTVHRGSRPTAWSKKHRRHKRHSSALQAKKLEKKMSRQPVLDSKKIEQILRASATAIKAEKKAAPALPLGLEDDLTKKIFSAPDEKKQAAPDVSYPTEKLFAPKRPEPELPRAPKEPFRISSFFRFLHRSAKVPKLVVAKAVAPVVPVGKKEELFDLDTLFNEPSEKSSKKKEGIAPELPREEVPIAAAKSATSTTQETPAAMVRKEAPVDQVVVVPKTDKKGKKAAPLIEPETAKAVAAPVAKKEISIEQAVPEIVYRPRPKRHHGAFSEMIGSFRYFGLGKERFAIIQNLATMLNAGLNLIDSLRTLQMETRNRAGKALLGRIVEAVENGSPLWRAMEDQSFFSPHAIALVRIGEEAGNLAENMEYLAIQQEKDQGLRAKVKMAMIYPTIVLVLMFGIIMGLGMFVLPNLISVLFSLKVKLPLITQIIVQFTQFFKAYGHIVAPGVIVASLFLVVLCKFTPLKVPAQWIVLHIPGIGALMRQATVARFGVILGGLLKAGVPLVDSMRSLAEVTPLVGYRHLYEGMLEHVIVGDSFAKSFKALRGSAKLIPLSVQQLIVTGEKSGSLAPILMKIADIYEKKANNTAEKLPVILEPMLLIFIGALVGTIALAIIIPIYSLVGSMNH